ncbi:Metalloprotease, partial [Daedaleopsis nitida]
VVAPYRGPSSVQSVGTLNIVTTVKNVGKESVKLLNHPRSPLSLSPTEIFSISNDRGDEPAFTGIEIVYAEDLAIDDESGFTNLLPGQSIETHHAIYEAYDFSSLATGRYTVRMKDMAALYYISSHEVAPVAPINGFASHSMYIYDTHSPGPLRMDEPEEEVCEAWQETMIREAIEVANEYAVSALYELRTAGHHGATYREWFGAPDHIRYATVLSHFEEIVANNFSDYSYLCNGWYCEPSYLAYVLPKEFGRVALCDLYFKPRTRLAGYRSRGSTIVHEASHFNLNGGATDIEYRILEAKLMAKKHPDESIMNAPSHEFFAVDAYAPILLAGTSGADIASIDGAQSVEVEEDAHCFLSFKGAMQCLWDLVRF